MNEHVSTEPGTVRVLSVGHGDTKLIFDKTNPLDVIRTKRIIKDMLRRGYALLIEVDGAWVRATDFDESKGEYVIADLDPIEAAASDMVEERAKQLEGPSEQSTTERTGAPEEASAPAPRERTKVVKGGRRVPADTTRAVSVARSAGG